MIRQSFHALNDSADSNNPRTAQHIPHIQKNNRGLVEELNLQPVVCLTAGVNA